MPRLPRTVFAGVPHHVTQRGNRRGQVFFTNEDRVLYLSWLQQYASEHGVDVLAYCLMSNHVRLVLLPATERSLQRVLKPLHMRYAQRINRVRDWKGHLWQGRYFSSALDDPYLWATIRYVERNPVRANMVDRAEDYPWSSAAPHCGLRTDPVLCRSATWNRQLENIDDWSEWLEESDESKVLETLRGYTAKGLPCGSPAFVRALEKRAGRPLQFRQPGRPRGSAAKR
jgi:putative transposase